MQMSSSSWLSPSLPRAPAGAGRSLSSCRGSPGVLGTGRECTWSPASLFIFALCGSVLSAHLGIPAPLPPPPSSSCRAVPLRWLRGKLSLVPSWGRTRGFRLAPGRGCSSSPRTGGRSWPPLLVPAWDTQRFGSCSGEARAPHLASQSPWPGDNGLCHSQPEQGSAGDSCSPGGRACSGCLSPLFPGLGREEPRSSLIPGTGPGWNLWAGGRGAGEHRGSSWETKAMFTSGSSGLAGTSGRGTA